MSSLNPHIKAGADLRLARAYAAKHLPWFAPALFRCNIVLTTSVTVAAIDEHYNVYWNPDSVNVMTTSSADRSRQLAELAFIWIHEISHVLREHKDRSKSIGAEASHWNCCADLEINDATWPGTRHPTLFPPLLPNDYGMQWGQLAEWYYRQTIKSGQPTQYVLDCGSGAHGQPRPWELEGKRQQLNATQQNLIRRGVAREMRSARPGTIPGYWEIWIQQILEPRVDWRNVLRQRLATAIALGSGARVDYSYRRPGRRQSVYDPLILPTLSGSLRSQLAVVIDTSGSMSGGPITRAISELYNILRAAHQRVTLIPCDATDYAPIELTSESQLRRITRLPGGGGTNMVAGIDAAAALKPLPDTILVLTDGYTPYPMAKYALPVIFGIIGARGNPLKRPSDPPWGDDCVVEIIA